jgi:broad specificity phosphatase PhoE
MKIVAVFHGEKRMRLGNYPPEIAANAPLTVKGMRQMQRLVEKLRPLGPFVAAYSSRPTRAVDSASVVCMALDLDFKTMKELGQHASGQKGKVIAYPGYENEWYADWQSRAIEAVQEIARKHKEDDVVLVFTHRPIIAGLVCHTKGITDEGEIRKLALTPQFSRRGYVIFEVNKEEKIRVAG